MQIYIHFVKLVQLFLKIILEKLRVFYLIVLSFLALGCQQQPAVLQRSFHESKVPAEVDYSKLENWAAHPLKKDMADSLPSYPGLVEGQANAKADVFFVHPTIYTYSPQNDFVWNGNVEDSQLNDKTDKSTILFQASVFNGSCKVYAPRYRQAHYYSFITANRADGDQALALAYTDVKAAFEYYLAHFNQGRPIVIASHSQGTYHTRRLLAEYFDGKDLQKQLVVAYLVGYDVAKSSYKTIAESNDPKQTGCYACWNTYSKGFIPKNYQKAMVHSTSTNPINWKSSQGAMADYSENKGGLGPKFTILPHVSNAQTHEGLLWIDKLNIKGAALLRIKVWHKADINLFWMNIRENVAERIDAFLDQK